MKILITGASRGIGLAEAKKLQKGNELFLVASSLDSFKEHFSNAKFFGYDLTTEDGVKNCVADIRSQTDSVDVLINNAGWFLLKKFEEMSWDEIDKIINLNLKSYIFLTKELLPFLKKGSKKQIIFMSSMAAKTAIVGESVYSATKAAVTNFANVLRNEFAGDIKVSTIHSYGVDTWGAKEDLNLLEPDNIAEAVEFIVNTKGDFLVESIDLSHIKQWRGGLAPWSPK